MKKTNIFVVVLSFLTLLLQACNRHIPAPAEIKIIPKPLELTKRQGVFKLNKKQRFIWRILFQPFRRLPGFLPVTLIRHHHLF